MDVCYQLAALVDQVDRLQLIATVAAVTLILVGPLLAGLPVGECDHCPHCRARRLDAPLPRCPLCGKRHPPGPHE